MSNETMPEKIYENFVDGEGMTVRQIADAFPNIAIGELARDLLESRRQNAALKEFADIMLNASFEGCDADGGDIQDNAERLHIIIPRKAKSKLVMMSMAGFTLVKVMRKFMMAGNIKRNQRGNKCQDYKRRAAQNHVCKKCTFAHGYKRNDSM